MFININDNKMYVSILCYLGDAILVIFFNKKH